MSKNPSELNLRRTVLYVALTVFAIIATMAILKESTKEVSARPIHTPLPKVE